MTAGVTTNPSSPSAPSASATRIKLNASFWRHSSCVPLSEDVIPSSLFLRHRHFLVIDVETQKLVQDVGGWEHVDKLGISVACAYDSKTDQFLSFQEHELKSLIELCEERLVVGYNIRGFDLLVMQPYGLDPKKLDVFDIMYDLEALTRQRFLKLEYVAQGTLNAGKSADGLMAVEWWKQGKIDKIIEYCLQDVRVTRDIFQFGRQNGFVKIRRGDDQEKTTQVPVQWN
jgi:DEAD/DEAH box helicase domain-containing protein